MIVFDFDKTLTYRDTTLAFFCHGLNTIHRVICTFLYYVLALLVKMRFIKVLTLKSILLKWRFKSIDKGQWEKHCKGFAASIKTNSLYALTDWADNNLVIISASFREVLQHLFPSNVKVMGTQVEISNGTVTITNHLYEERKRRALEEQHIYFIDEFYTDSWHDSSVMGMAKKIYWVNGNQVTELKAKP